MVLPPSCCPTASPGRAVVDIPAGTPPSEFVRFRLAPSLPYSPTEAIFGHNTLGGHRVLAAAVRRDVVAGYEAARPCRRSRRGGG